MASTTHVGSEPRLACSLEMLGIVFAWNFAKPQKNVFILNDR